MGTFKALFLTQLTMANMEKGTEYTNLSVLIFGLGANQTWNLSKKFTPPDFQAKNFTPSVSPNFNSFSGKKNTKNE